MNRLESSIKAWNPQAVLHTLCAFANDIDNWGGGYIVIGLSETNGQPILPPTGLPVESLDSTMKELLQISKLIKPEYLPICEPVTYEGKNLLMIWAPGGYDRPYDCPESLSKNAGRSSYIRKMSNTIKASRKDVQELHDIGSNIPYDDRLNLHAEPGDLKINLKGKRKRRTREEMEQDILLLLSKNGELSTNEVAKNLAIVLFLLH
ncbi:MAG: putative DNA binding domain-containing protein [Bacillota bacterium]|nr:putative DNA binding domain-containing protein [Bacillota bacterium]